MGPWAWGIFTSTLIASWETNAGLYTRAVGCRHHCRRRTAATMLPPSHCHRRSVTAWAAARQPPPLPPPRWQACSAARLKAEMNDSSFKGNPFSAQAQCKPSYSCRIYPVDPPPLRICLPSSPIHSDLFFENSKASFLKVWSLEFTFKPPKCQKWEFCCKTPENVASNIWEFCFQILFFPFLSKNVSKLLAFRMRFLIIVHCASCGFALVTVKKGLATLGRAWTCTRSIERDTSTVMY